MSDWEERVRAAYAVGWALSGGPMTDRVRAGCLAAIEWAREHRDDPDVLEATIDIGSLEGTWAALFERREALYKQHAASVLAAWRDLIDTDGIHAMVTAYRKAIGVHETTDDKERRRAEATAAALAFLHGHVNPTQAPYQRLVLAIADGQQDARAEGWAGAVAVEADRLGRRVDFDRLAAAAPTRHDPGTAYSEAEDVAADIINGAVTDLAATLDGADDTESDDDLAAAAAATLAAGRAATTLFDWAMGLAFIAGVMSLFQAEGVDLVDFVTAADSRVCPRCLEIESSNPWRRGEVEEPAIHPFCRCVLLPAEQLPSLRSVNLDDYA